MFLRTILFIGIQLLCFTNANPMVLLTANVEDIKKIARKFLSDNVADTIAEFLIKATGGFRNNDQISAENDQNQQDINNISVEGKIGRSDKRRQTTTPANQFEDYDDKTTKRHKKISSKRIVYYTPAFEANTERLDGDFDEDFRTDATANDDTQIKQVRDLYTPRNNEDNYEKYDETITVVGDQDVEIQKPRQPKYFANKEEESLPKYTRSQYSKKAKHRLIATSGSIILPRLGDASQE